MFEYGNLRFVQDLGWKFLVEGEVRDVETEGFIEVFNELGVDGWELITYVDEVGYMFKRSVK